MRWDSLQKLRKGRLNRFVASETGTAARTGPRQKVMKKSGCVWRSRADVTLSPRKLDGVAVQVAAVEGLAAMVPASEYR